MTIEHYIIAKLAEVMWIAGADTQEREAIGCMVRNQVAKDGCRWDQMLRYWNPVVRNAYDPAFIKTLWAAEDIYYNRMADVTDGATACQTEPCINSVRIGRFYFTVRG